MNIEQLMSEIDELLGGDMEISAEEVREPIKDFFRRHREEELTYELVLECYSEVMSRAYEEGIFAEGKRSGKRVPFLVLPFLFHMFCVLEKVFSDWRIPFPNDLKEAIEAMKRHPGAVVETGTESVHCPLEAETFEISIPDDGENVRIHLREGLELKPLIEFCLYVSSRFPLDKTDVLQCLLTGEGIDDVPKWGEINLQVPDRRFLPATITVRLYTAHINQSEVKELARYLKRQLEILKHRIQRPVLMSPEDRLLVGIMDHVDEEYRRPRKGVYKEKVAEEYNFFSPKTFSPDNIRKKRKNILTKHRSLLKEIGVTI